MPIQIPETEIIFKSQIFATRQFDGIFRNCNCDAMRDHPYILKEILIYDVLNRQTYSELKGFYRRSGSKWTTSTNILPDSAFYNNRIHMSIH